MGHPAEPLTVVQRLWDAQIRWERVISVRSSRASRALPKRDSRAGESDRAGPCGRAYFAERCFTNCVDPCLKDARTTCTDTGYTPNGAALVEVRLPVEQSVVFELVRTALCFVSCSSSALSLLGMSMRHVPVIGVACDALQQQQQSVSWSRAGSGRPDTRRAREHCFYIQTARARVAARPGQICPVASDCCWRRWVLLPVPMGDSKG